MTLNAKITVLPGLLPIRVGEPAGTVQFKDGNTDIGAPVPVTPNTAVPDPPTGTASRTTSTLAVGSHQLTAVFTPSSLGILPSTSPAVTFVVNVTGVRDTRTTLRVFPAGPLPAGTPRLLLARVAPGAAAGTVQFKDGDTALEAPEPVVNGFAFIITRQLTTVGTHPLTAMFTPTNPTAFNPSTSNTVRVRVEG